MSQRFEGKVALVTGAARGIGRSIALAIGAEGAEVICADLTEEMALDTTETIIGAGGRARPVGIDITQEKQVDEGVEKLLGAYGTIPLLVNNAGVTRDRLLMRMKSADWDFVLNTNLTGMFRLCRKLVPAMIRARYGRIVSISSVVASLGNAGQTNYAAAKAGMEGFTRSLAREVASRNITANCVAPGFIDTDMTRALEEKARNRLIDQIPMKRLGTPEDVAGAVLFLLGDESSYITGMTLKVNGGMLM